MTLKSMKTSKYVLSMMLKIIAACEHYQALTDDAVKLMWHDNNDWKIKHDCFKKLSILNIW